MAPLQPTSLQQWQWQLQCQLTAAASETKGDENKINQNHYQGGDGRNIQEGKESERRINKNNKFKSVSQSVSQCQSVSVSDSFVAWWIFSLAPQAPHQPLQALLPGKFSALTTSCSRQTSTEQSAFGARSDIQLAIAHGPARSPLLSFAFLTHVSTHSYKAAKISISKISTKSPFVLIYATPPRGPGVCINIERKALLRHLAQQMTLRPSHFNLQSSRM